RLAGPRYFEGHLATTEHGDAFVRESGHVTAVAFTTDGRWVVSGDERGRVFRWPLAAAESRNDRSTLDAIKLQREAAERVASRTLPEGTAVIAAHDAAILSLSMELGPDGNERLVTGGAEGLVKIWPRLDSWPLGESKPEPTSVFRGHDGPVTAVAAVT